MKFYVEIAIEYEAVSEPKALVAAKNIAAAAESLLGCRALITDVRHRTQRHGERSLLQSTSHET